MQGTLAPCFVKEKLTETRLRLESDETNEENSPEIDICGIAELVAGYMDCMQEAVNYLREVERYSDDHPAIIGLMSHLTDYRQQLLLVDQTVRIDLNLQSPSKS